MINEILYGTNKGLTTDDHLTSKNTEEGSMLQKIELSDAYDEKELSILRKKHNRNVSAATFFADMGDDVYEEIREIYTIEADLVYASDEFLELCTKDSLNVVSHRIEEFAKYLRNYFGFDELNEVLISFSTILKNISEELLSQKSTVISLYLQAIVADIKGWIKNVITEKTADDIHYLDASLMSSCMQLGLELKERKLEDEDDVEFF